MSNNIPAARDPIFDVHPLPTTHAQALYGNNIQGLSRHVDISKNVCMIWSESDSFCDYWKAFDAHIYGKFPNVLMVICFCVIFDITRSPVRKYTLVQLKVKTHYLLLAR